MLQSPVRSSWILARRAGCFITTLLVAVATTGAHAASASAEKVIADSIEAMGGAAAIAKIDTLHTTATITVGMTVINMDSYWAKTSERLVKQSMQGVTLTTGYDGRVGWESNPGGTRPIGEEKIDQLDDQASMHMRLLTMDKTGQKHFRSIESVGDATFGGRPCHRLHVVTTDETPDEGYLYFDTETRLPLGWEITSSGPAGDTTERTTLSEWKPANGVQFFRKMEVRAGDQAIILRVTNIAINDTAPEVFIAPDAIRQAVPPKSGKQTKLEDFTPEQRAQIEETLKGFMRMTDADQLEGAAKSLEASIAFMPADQRAPMKYVVARVRERVRELRGG